MSADVRVLSLGGFALSGVCQVALAALKYADGALADAGLSALVGLGVLWVFGRPLVRGDDLNGVASRPVFGVVGVAIGVASAAILLYTLGG
ncbi:hypothetical protein [Halobaculum magnesiiphilum]|uniref:Uncharacterized protein n=1 Tax=Halobaculum magnesiiphilum TaxID=1017351 RepID=A0A8T8W9F3_9EURY|nr:hypothetical protein [Halobaculum magnesiiphilum]QZP36458.1 hypothetical protein K6T50_08945 [Halobaculum magnesiiphilum]